MITGERRAHKKKINIPLYSFNFDLISDSNGHLMMWSTLLDSIPAFRNQQTMLHLLT